MSFAQKVWDSLSQMDISLHTEEMPGPRGRTMTYLPWHKAWLMVKRLYPASTYWHEPDITHSDGTMEVGVLVKICTDEHSGLATSCYARLGVMDSKFNAIENPDARAINDSRQRALVKALAFMGLGLSLWDDGSQVPVGLLDKPINEKQLAELEALIQTTDTNLEHFLAWAGVPTLAELSLEKFDSATRLLKSKATKQRSSS